MNVKAWVQNTTFKLDTVYWDVTKGDNKVIWRLLLSTCIVAGILIGRSL
mgnify:CR=1 FL=1